MSAGDGVQSSRKRRISMVFKKNLPQQNSIFKLKLAPFDVPRARRLETLAAFSWIMTTLFVGPISWITFIYFIVHTTIARYLGIAYFLWMYMDKSTCEKGGRRWNWFRRMNWWRYFKDYFPVKLVTKTSLPPDRNYLFAVFPHGILSSGAFSAFATDAHDLDKVMPGIKPYVCTLKINFDMPIAREVTLAAGLCAASRESLDWILGSPGKGRAAVLVVGGAAEALYNEPGVQKIFLRHRKGFCKVALRNGSPLVPVFSFGEIDLYNTLEPKEGSLIDRMRFWVKAKTGVIPMFFYGRGIFNYSFGFVPKRLPVHVVVGEPIEVTKVDHPTNEEIDALHSKFMDAIVELYNTEKHKYLEDPDTDLIID